VYEYSLYIARDAKEIREKKLPRGIPEARQECDVFRLSQYLEIEIFETGANQGSEYCAAVSDIVAILPTGFGKS